MAVQIWLHASVLKDVMREQVKSFEKLLDRFGLIGKNIIDEPELNDIS